MTTSNHNFIKFIIIFVFILTIILWHLCGFEAILTTVIAGLLVGLCSSFAITYLFEKEKVETRKKIKSLTIENFIYSCAQYIISLELWYKSNYHTEYKIFDNPKIMLDILQTLRDANRNIPSTDIDEKFTQLINEYIYSVGPVYHSYILLDNQQLLLTEVLNTNEYQFFHNIIRKDIFKSHLSLNEKDRFAEKIDGYTIFHELRVCLNCVIDAKEIFPEIIEKYNKLLS